MWMQSRYNLNSYLLVPNLCTYNATVYVNIIIIIFLDLNFFSRIVNIFYAGN